MNEGRPRALVQRESATWFEGCALLPGCPTWDGGKGSSPHKARRSFATTKYHSFGNSKKHKCLDLQFCRPDEGVSRAMLPLKPIEGKPFPLLAPGGSCQSLACSCDTQSPLLLSHNLLPLFLCPNFPVICDWDPLLFSMTSY